MIEIRPVEGIRGEINVPGDKSISHRAAILGALSKEGITVGNFSTGEDCKTTLTCLKALGCEITKPDDKTGAKDLRDPDHLRSGAAGFENKVTIKAPQGLREPKNILDAGNSGTTARLLLGLISGIPNLFAVINGDESLKGRPMGRVTGPLISMGAKIDGREFGEKLPLAVRGKKLNGGIHVLQVASAQVKTAILLAGLGAQGATTVIEPSPTRDHTEIMLEFLGVPVFKSDLKTTVYPTSLINGGSWTIPGDFSSAAFWIVAAAITRESELQIKNVNVNPTRTGLLNVLKRMGLLYSIEDETLSGGEKTATIVVKSSSLKGTKVMPEEIPSLIDELPLLAVAATQAEGITEVTGAQELRVKESDRIHTMAVGLKKMGAQIKETKDGWIIKGKTPLAGGKTKSYGDHRIAMALAVAGLAATSPLHLEGESCVRISYPSFFETLRKLTQNTEVREGIQP
ncbi:MAG: 3-phosphoshikimate 1-carboxyvinyltransferase [Acetomicrobium sp.]